MRVEFEALPEEVKPFVVGLDELEKALSNLTQKIDLTQQERTVESGKYGSQLGYTPVDYTLYVSDDEVEVTEVKYKGEAVDNTYDKWTFVNNGDGTLTLTLAGNYWKDPAKKGWLYGSSMHESIKKGEGNYWVFAKDYPVFDVKKGDTLNPDKFVGTFVRDVSLDNLGDHMITVVLSDGTEKEINLRSYVSWSNLNANPKSASEDAIQPSTSWKIASTNTSIEGRAFDGDLTNGTNSTTFVAAYNDKDGNGVSNGQHILFGVGHTVWLDLATPTKIGGIRLYNSDKNVLNDVELYGSNNLETWTLIGSVKDNNTKSITVTTINNDAYRYIEVKNTKYNNGSPTYAWYSEIEVLKAETRVAGNNVVTFDPSEEIEAEFAIALEGEETLTGVTDAEDEAIEYTYEDGVITIDRDYLLTLANGTIEFKATFSNGAVVTLTVDKKDSSKTSYLLADKSTGRASEALELESLSGKAVKSVSVNGANIEYSVNGNNTLITIGRRAFRNSYELFATMDVVTNGVVEVLVTYEDESTKTFYVTITSEWLTIGEPTATFKADEVVPATGAWKIRTSAASSNYNTGVGAFYLPAQNSANHQHWHTSYTGTGNVADQDLDHFIDVDFGANAPSYNGVRIMERVGGSYYAKVTVYGKNADGEDWTLLGEATPARVNPVEVKFNDTVNYRYVRMRFDGNSTHVTADTIHFTKPVASLASDKAVTVDTNIAETATFKFNLVEGAASAIEVMVDGNVIENTNYTWAEGVLVLSAEYTATLAEGDHTVTATIDAFPITLTIKKADRYTVSYVLAGGNANPRGTENLVLGIPAGKTVSGITYKGTDVAYTTTENNITISRSAFRGLDDMFDMTSLKLDVTFEGDEEATPYTVNLSKVAFTVSGADAANFAEDEIVAADGWEVTVSSARDANGTPSLMFKKPTGVTNAWHTGYEEKNGQAIADSAFPRNYLEVDFGEEALKFAGFRYYARSEANQTSGVWQGVIVYGRNSADEDWKEIKSQNFAWADWKNVRETTVYFGEDVSYKQLRFVIDCDGHATGRGFAFLKPGSRPEAPEESEGKVNIQVTPTTGGNVTVNETPSLGDNYVASNTDVTFTAKSDVSGGFKYWIEANTGKILGTDSTLTVKSAIGKDIKAVFADPSAFEAFVSFYGRNGKNILATSYVKKGNAPTVPSAEKLYTTGYEFKFWTNKEGTQVDAAAAVTENTDFYAYYEEKTDEAKKESTITVTNGTIKAVGSGVAGKAEGTFAYDTKVCAKANTAPDGQKFSHWTLDGKVVSYSTDYFFFAPDVDIALVAVFVEDAEVVEEGVTITITQTSDMVNGIDVAGFITTRYVPEGTEVIETDYKA
ncbi:MAG: discoidin domain-containing protein, partial [Clostridia bacterium]|nr:discoidin domain-containing protein [Clostridia bacterium]